MRKTRKHVSQNKECSGHYSNWGPSRYKSGAVLVHRHGWCEKTCINIFSVKYIKECENAVVINLAFVMSAVHVRGLMCRFWKNVCSMLTHPCQPQKNITSPLAVKFNRSQLEKRQVKWCFSTTLSVLSTM